MKLPHPSVSFFLLLLLWLVAGCGESSRDESRSENPIGPVVFVLSLDGLHPAGLEEAETPFFDRLIAESPHTMEMRPVFPSLTFPTHVSQATGVPPGRHGIVANSFYDSRRDYTFRYPGSSWILDAEPIWNTAERQGVRTAVLDWPLSHRQEGPNAASYHGEAYDRGLSDEERIGRILDLWEEDEGDPPLRLLLGYAQSPDQEGHRYGPDAPETLEAVTRVDRLAKHAYERAIEIWKSKNPGPDDTLYFVVTSDHGMTQVDTLVHVEKLTDLEDYEAITITTSGSIANIHLDEVEDPDQRAALSRKILDRVADYDFVRAFPRNEIPEEWGVRHEHRTGELFLTLDEGYTFNRRADGITMPAEEAGGPLGMHGYHPDEVPAMRHPFIVHRYPDPIGRVELGPASALQVHATIARLLEIEPSPDAADEPLQWAKIGSPIDPD